MGGKSNTKSSLATEKSAPIASNNSYARIISKRGNKFFSNTKNIQGLLMPRWNIPILTDIKEKELKKNIRH